MSEGYRRVRPIGSRSVENLPIAFVVAHYGGEVREGKNVSVRCFLHPDKRRSAVIDTVKQVYYCHTCAQGGNAINLVMIKEGVDKKDAYKIAVGITSQGGSGVSRGAQRRGNKLPRRTWDI